MTICSVCGGDANASCHGITEARAKAAPEGVRTTETLWFLLDRAYKMMQMAGYNVAEHNPDHNNPIIAWMADARVVLYGKSVQEKAAPDMVLVPRGLAERTEAMFRSVDPDGSLAQEWLAAAPSRGVT